MQHNRAANKEPKFCQAKRYDDSPCGRDLFDDKYCIFHSKDIERKKAKFEKEFWKEFEKQSKKEIKFFDFSRFIFPDSMSFEKKEFKKSTYFIEAQFSGKITNFENAKFLGKFTYFGGAKFEAQVTSFGMAKFLGYEINFGVCEFAIMVPPTFSKVIKLSGCEFLSERNNFSFAKFKSKSINFKGTKFSGTVDFCKAEFIGNVEFCGCSDYVDGPYDGANFERNAIFLRAKFKGEDSDFSLARFSRADFSEVEFLSKNTNFSKAIFSNDVDFGTYYYKLDWEAKAAKFSGENIYFNESQFLGKTNFRDVEFSGRNINFEGAQFLGYANFINAEFSIKKISLFNSKFRNVSGLFEALSYKKKYFKRKYKIEDFRFNLEEDSAISYPLIKKLTQDAWYLADFKRQHPKIYFLWWLFADCGRSLLRWAVWSLGIAVMFAIIFMISGQDAFETRHHTWFSFFYYSIVTFTTLGFGDITPIKWFTEIFVTLEVIFGYIMLGGLISIFANKLARRS